MANLAYQIPNSPVFMPKPDATEWWEGDGSKLRLWQKESDAPAIAVYPHLLAPDNCQTLIDCFKRCREEYAEKTDVDFWNSRYIHSFRLPRTEIAALRIMQQLRNFATIQVLNEYCPNLPIYSDDAHLVEWSKDIELTPHCDNCDPDGKPNNVSHRSFSSILYLNDDFEGGETYFPGHNVKFKPQAGTMVIFGAGPEFVHGVTKITKGKRYTYAGWFTHVPQFEDPTARAVY